MPRRRGHGSELALDAHKGAEGVGRAGVADGEELPALDAGEGAEGVGGEEKEN